MPPRTCKRHVHTRWQPLQRPAMAVPQQQWHQILRWSCTHRWSRTTPECWMWTPRLGTEFTTNRYGTAGAARVICSRPASVFHDRRLPQSGNPAGVPVLSLHGAVPCCGRVVCCSFLTTIVSMLSTGGPGVGCSPATRSCFNPDTYRIVLFDQRGAGRSTPLGCLTNNTTAHLIEDIEKLRKHLGVRRWGMVTGGSWGCFLAVAYTQLHSNRVAGLLLRSVFMGSDAEVKWLCVRGRGLRAALTIADTHTVAEHRFEAGGASEFYPEAWERYVPACMGACACALSVSYCWCGPQFPADNSRGRAGVYGAGILQAAHTLQ